MWIQVLFVKLNPNSITKDWTHFSLCIKSLIFFCFSSEKNCCLYWISIYTHSIIVTKLLGFWAIISYSTNASNLFSSLSRLVYVVKFFENSNITLNCCSSLICKTGTRLRKTFLKTDLSFKTNTLDVFLKNVYVGLWRGHVVRRTSGVILWKSASSGSFTNYEVGWYGLQVQRPTLRITRSFCESRYGSSWR